jgi:uncharacterized repeat protein (TIGR01451 family)
VATNGQVTVVDTLPAGLTATAMSGPGWDCDVASTSCTRSDPLDAGATYQAITLTVDVAAFTQPTLTNMATVAGGGETNTGNDIATDTTIVGIASFAPDLTLTKYHAGDLTQSQPGAIYSLIVHNIGAAQTLGEVTVTDTLPASLSLTDMSGPGWDCTPAATTCKRSDALDPGASYPAITLKVDVAAGAPPAVTNEAAVSCGCEPAPATANNSAEDPTTIDPASAGPDLIVTKSHAGNFSQGQPGAVYSVVVRNIGGNATSGTVTLSDALPAALTPSDMSGIGWTCTPATTSCIRNDALAPGDSYPAITLVVDVAANAPALVTNAATVSGGGEANTFNSVASDPTTIDAASADPDLTLTKSHAGNFSRGQTGAVYSLIVRNIGGTATSGTVTLSDALPAGLTPADMSGTGWNCNVAAKSCTRNDTLAVGASYPEVKLTVDVAAGAPDSIVNTASVSGGGETNTLNDSADDPTTIGGLLAAPTVSKSFTPNHVIAGDLVGTSVMKIALTNSDPNTAMTGVQFTDSYPTPVHMANAPNDVVLANTCGGTLTADANGTSVALSGGVIPANDTCYVNIQIVGTSAGISNNHTGPVTSGNADPGADAVGTLTVTDGTPISQTINFTSTAPLNAVVGGPTYLATAIATSGLPVALTIDGASATVCTIDNGGVVSFIGVGTCTIDANQSGNATYAPAPQQQQTFAVASAGGTTSQTIMFTSTAPANAFVAGSSYFPTATATSGLPVVLTIDNASANVCTMTSGNVNYIGAGTCTIDANQGGDGTYAPAVQVQQSFAVAAAGGAASQLIAFTSIAPAGAIVGGPTYLATASTTSGLPVVLTIDGTSATVCAINSGTVTFIGAGTCTIDANQGGDSTYAPAPQVQQTFDVTGAGGVPSQSIHFTSTAPVDATVAGPGYLAMATATSNLPVVLTIDAASATVCTISNDTVSFIGAGTCIVDANQGGDAMFAPASQVQQAFAVAGAAGVAPQSITFTSTAPAGSMVAGPTYLATATATSHLPVVLTIDGSSATVCAINNGIVTFIGAGVCTIDANQGGDATYAPAPQVQQLIEVDSAGGVGSQTIAFTSTAPSNATVAGPSYSAAAAATSGLPVVLTIDGASATVCTINNGTVTFIGAGICTIDANQGGDATYAAAPQVQQAFAVASAGGVSSQTIQFTSTAPVGATVGGPSYLATAIATSGMPVVLTIDGTSTSVCAINNGTVTFIGAGACTIDANQGGNATYAPAPQLQQSFTVAGAGGAISQSIQFTSTAPTNAIVAGPSYVVTATATSGLPVALTIDSTSVTVCTLNNDTVSFIGAGACTIDANQGGDSTYAPAPQMQQSFTVAGAGGAISQSIQFTSTAPANAIVAGPSYVVTATATSGLPVALTIDSTSVTVCTINNGTVSFIGAGLCTIDANQGGDATYAPAPQVQQTFAVAGAGGAIPQTIDFTSVAPAMATVGGASYLATAVATSGLPVVLTIDSTSTGVCAINNGSVTFTDTGTCTIDANQGGDATYAPAPQVQQAFAVGPPVDDLIFRDGFDGP